MIPALSQARNQTHPASIRRTRHDMNYRGNWLWVHYLTKGLEDISRGKTKLVGIRKYLALKGAKMGYVVGRKLMRLLIRWVRGGD